MTSREFALSSVSCIDIDLNLESTTLCSNPWDNFLFFKTRLKATYPNAIVHIELEIPAAFVPQQNPLVCRFPLLFLHTLHPSILA